MHSLRKARPVRRTIAGHQLSLVLLRKGFVGFWSTISVAFGLWLWAYRRALGKWTQGPLSQLKAIG